MARGRGVASRLSDAVSLVRQVVRRLGWTHAFLWLCGAIGRRASVHIFVITTHAIDRAVPTDAPNHSELEAQFLTPSASLSRRRSFALKALLLSLLTSKPTTLHL